MKKALYVATVDIHIKSFHLPYLKLLKDMGYEVHVATNGYEEFPNCDVKHTICIERSPYKFNNIKAIKQLKEIIKKEKFDIIHCHTPMGSVVTRLAAKKSRKNGTKVIYTAHGFHFYKGAPIINWLLFYPVEKYLAKYTDTLITINNEDYQLAKRKFSRRCKNIEYVPGVGIDPEKFNFSLTEKEKMELRKSLGLKKDDFVMIYPARLDKNKNQGFLIDCMELLIKGHKDIHLLLPGKDELNGYYQKKVKEKHLENNIHFLGFRDDIPKLMKISNLALSSSLREGLPINLIEAMCCNLPIVALECRGVSDLITGDNSCLVKNDNKNKIYSYILTFKNNNINFNYDKKKIKKYYISFVKDELKKIYLN